jgi:glycosyltransferase involved in cell wall biosynthesis
MPGSPGVSVVIPTRDRAALIGFQLEALATQTTERDFEVIVADNGSTDDTEAVVRSFADRFAHVEVVDASTRLGSAHARNVGVAAARGGIIAFCDSDDVVAADWLEHLVAAWRPSAIIAGRTRPLRDGGGAGSAPDPDVGQHRRVQLEFLPHADGGNLSIGRQELLDMGGFDETFLFSQDVELSWRAQVAGLDFVNAPEAIVFKRPPTGSWRRFRQFYRWGCTAPRLYRHFRGAGMTRRSRRTVARSYAAATYHLVLAPIDQKHRDRALRQAGRCTGHVFGSIRYRVPYL